ncbi:MAG: transporter substrate-binding domain-containing protein [Candidatus Methylacidiphilales bacterium]|nr:transporter substrate-binding domain-containing protein [Candidatus Methylacidiphilales bacterium]
MHQPGLMVFLFALTAGTGLVAAPPLRVGMELSYPPFEMTDEQGRPTGVSVDMAAALAKELGRTLEISNIAFDGLIPSLKTGKIDLIISSMTANEERARSIAFSDPYLTTGLGLLVTRHSTLSGVGALDEKGRRVAVKKGTTGHLYAVKHFQKADLLIFDKESAAVLEVGQGKADAFIYDQMSVYQQAVKDPLKLRALLAPIQTESWAVGLRKGDEPLRAQVNAFLAKFRADGGFTRLGDKYLSDQKKAFQAQGIPFLF